MGGNQFALLTVPRISTALEIEEALAFHETLPLKGLELGIQCEASAWK